MNNDLKTAFGACAENNAENKVDTETVKSVYGLGDGSDLYSEAARFKQAELFCTPGHKGELNSLDVTEYDEDTLFPAGLVAKAEEKAARFYKVGKLRFSLGGSSMSIKAALLSVKGDVVAPVFTHRCVKEGAALANVKYFTFDTGEADGLPNVPTPDDYIKAFAAYPSAKVAVVTSPDYFGRVADVKAISDACRRWGKLLIADAAHGAHFASRPDLFPYPAEQEADFAAMSAHKTLRAPTMTAFGAVNNKDYFDAYDAAFVNLGSSSPSYLLLGALERAVEYEKQNRASYDGLVEACKALKAEIKCLENDDPLRIVVSTAEYGMSGKELYYRMFERKIIPETYFGDYTVFIVTLSDSEEKIKDLAGGLKCALGLTV